LSARRTLGVGAVDLDEEDVRVEVPTGALLSIIAPVCWENINWTAVIALSGVGLGAWSLIRQVLREKRESEDLIQKRLDELRFLMTEAMVELSVVYEGKIGDKLWRREMCIEKLTELVGSPVFTREVLGAIRKRVFRVWRRLRLLKSGGGKAYEIPYEFKEKDMGWVLVVRGLVRVAFGDLGNALKRLGVEDLAELQEYKEKTKQASVDAAVSFAERYLKRVIAEEGRGDREKK